MVERELPKLEVASSSLVARSRQDPLLGHGDFELSFIPAGYQPGGRMKVGSARFFLWLIPGDEIFPGTWAEIYRIETAESMSDAVIGRVTEFAESLLPAMGLELFDVQFRREGHGWVLRLVVDSETGVTLDDCSQVSRETSDFLEVEDLIDHQYHLEVSSPGLERPLRTIDECTRHIGKKARVKLIEPIEEQKVFIGDIQKVEVDQLTVLSEEGKTYTFAWNNVQKARLTL